MASVLRVDQLQTPSGTNVMTFDAAGNTVLSSGLKLPFFTNSNRPTGSLGLIIYNSEEERVEIFDGTEWISLGSSGKLDGSSPEKAALSASTLKQDLGASATNGSYWYRFNDGQTRQLWTDFTTYPNFSFVMVTRIWSGSQNQYLTGEENVTDLAITPSNSAPSRHAKLSDAYMNDIIVPGTIRWAIVGNGSIFYRLDDNPQWYSNHGASQSCSYNRGFYDAYATPNTNPSWNTSFGIYQACGGAYDSSNNWLSLTGIHINDGVYFGGYSGGSGFRLTPPSPYSVGGTANNSWSQNGYVLLNW